MSGIYGFSNIIDESAEQKSTRLKILEQRNRMYGAQGSESKLIPEGAFGCHVEHFSDRFAADKPILQYDEYNYAVIDALIFNRDELLAYLTSQVDPYATEAALFSDERLLLHIYSTYGKNGLRRVNGDFAGAILDTRTRQWTLFRDHLGVRPLFFYQDTNVFAFSTDIRGLTAMPGADTSVDEAELYLHLTMQNTLDNRRTDFARIQCVPAGCVLIVSQDASFSVVEQCYWRPGEQKIRLSGGELAYQTELRRLVTDAITRRMQSVSGKIGVELSGGLDSSVISVIAHRIDPQTLFASWSDDPNEYPMQEGDVRKNIEAICTQEDLTCKYLSFSEIAGAKYQHALSADPPAPPYINTLDIGEAARYFRAQDAQVILSGQGGDEGCSHRCSLLELYHQHEYIKFLNDIFFATKGRSFRFLRTVLTAFRAVFVRYSTLKKPWVRDNSTHIGIINNVFARSMTMKVSSQVFWFPLAPERFIDQGGERLRTETTAILAAENGIRYLFPFLDYKLIDFSVSIPRYLFRRGAVNRYIYREAFRDLLPESMYTYTSKTDMGSKVMHFETRRKNIINGSRYYLDLLNENKWANYLDFEGIHKIIQNAELDINTITANNIDEYAEAANQLYRCVLIQRLQEESRKHSAEQPLPIA